eukprot:12838969-Alexandrium_andersonii.AAC.1
MASSAAVLERHFGGWGHALRRSVWSAGKGSGSPASLGAGASLEPRESRPARAEPVALRRSFHAASSSA